MYMHEFFHYISDALECDKTPWIESIELVQRTRTETIASLILGKSDEYAVILKPNPSKEAVVAAISSFYHCYDQLINQANEKYSVILCYHLEKTMRILVFDSEKCSKNQVSFKAFYFTQVCKTVLLHKFDALFESEVFFPLALNDQNECLKVPETDLLVLYAFSDNNSNLISRINYYLVNLAASFRGAILDDVRMWYFKNESQFLIVMRRKKDGKILNFSHQTNLICLLDKAKKGSKFGFPVRIFDENLERYQSFYFTYLNKSECIVSNDFGMNEMNLGEFLETFNFQYESFDSSDSTLTVESIIKFADLDELKNNFAIFSFWDWNKIDLNPNKKAFLSMMRLDENSLAESVVAFCQISTFLAFLKKCGLFYIHIHPIHSHMIFIRHIEHPVSLIFEIGERNYAWFDQAESYLNFDGHFFFSEHPKSSSSIQFQSDANFHLLLVNWMAKQFEKIFHFSQAFEFEKNKQYHTEVIDYYVENAKIFAQNLDMLYSCEETVYLLHQLSSKKNHSILPTEILRKLKLNGFLMDKLLNFPCKRKAYI